MQKYNSYVIVKDGIYDIIEEYKELYGVDYFDNFKKGNINNGILLRNNIYITFSDSAFVVCHYKGNNQDVMNEFSPFNSAAWDGFKNVSYCINGLKIDASNVRYVIHDEMGISPHKYEHIYKNCKMRIDNTFSVANEKRVQCIGGGLGLLGTIYIESCIFESESAKYDNCGIVSYHNSAGDNAQSKLYIICNRFLDKGTFRLSSYGSSELISKAWVIGNHLGSEIIDNFEKEYNNNTPKNTEIISSYNSIDNKDEREFIDESITLSLPDIDGSSLVRFPNFKLYKGSTYKVSVDFSNLNDCYLTIIQGDSVFSQLLHIHSSNSGKILSFEPSEDSYLIVQLSGKSGIIENVHIKVWEDSGTLGMANNYYRYKNNYYNIDGSINKSNTIIIKKDYNGHYKKVVNMKYR